MNQPQPAPPALDLDAIQARCDAATPGPWQIEWDTDDVTDTPFPISIGPFGYLEHRGEREAADTEFAAHARTDVEQLLARVRELEARLDERTGDIADRALENASLRAENERLADVGRRALASLDELIRDHTDPGVEALGARYQLAQALISHPHVCGNCDHADPASCLTT